ncbi:MAG: glycosyltransferase family 4 protein [Bacteroidales bacterium]
MQIAVNTRLLLKGKLEGIGWFTYENLLRITRQHPEHQFYFLFDRPYCNDFIFSENITPVVLRPQSRHPVLWYIWFEWSVSRFLRKTKVDVFLSPDGFIPLRTKTPQIAVIHDINFYHDPQGLPLLTSWYLNKFFPQFARHASRVVTVSQFSKNDIINSYQVNASKIDVVYNGANSKFQPLTASAAEDVRKELSDGLPYFVFVGAFSPRKNVNRLIKAYSIFRDKTNAPVKLVLVGEPMFKTTAIQKAYNQSKYKSDIVFAGRKEVESLWKIVGAATAMIYPPLFEGFGIPILEAMKCDIPLAVSNTTSMPEVAGNAAIYFDPLDPEEIANSMMALWSNPDLRLQLVSNARIQREKFSWDLAAEKIYRSMLEAVKNGQTQS